MCLDRYPSRCVSRSCRPTPPLAGPQHTSRSVHNEAPILHSCCHQHPAQLAHQQLRRPLLPHAVQVQGPQLSRLCADPHMAPLLLETSTNRMHRYQRHAVSSRRHTPAHKTGAAPLPSELCVMPCAVSSHRCTSPLRWCRDRAPCSPQPPPRSSLHRAVPNRRLEGGLCAALPPPADHRLPALDHTGYSFGSKDTQGRPAPTGLEVCHSCGSRPSPLTG